MNRNIIAIAVVLGLATPARAGGLLPFDPTTNASNGIRTAVNSCQAEIVAHLVGDDTQRWGFNPELGALINPSTHEALSVDAAGQLRYVASGGAFVLFDRDCYVLAGDPADLDFPAPPVVDPPPALLCQSGSGDSGGGGGGGEGGGGTGASCGGFASLAFPIDVSADAYEFGGVTYNDADTGMYVFQAGQVHDEDTGHTIGAMMGVVELPDGVCFAGAIGAYADPSYSSTSPFAPFGAPDDPVLASVFDTSQGSVVGMLGQVAQDAGWSPPVLALGWEGYAADPDDLVASAHTVTSTVLGWTADVVGYIGLAGVATVPTAEAAKWLAVEIAGVETGLNVFSRLSDQLSDLGLAAADPAYWSDHPGERTTCGSRAACAGLDFAGGMRLAKACEEALPECTNARVDACIARDECITGAAAYDRRHDSDLPAIELDDTPVGYDGFTDPAGNPLDPGVVGGNIDWGDDNPMVDGPVADYLTYDWMPVLDSPPEWWEQPTGDETASGDECFNPWYSPTLPGSGLDCPDGTSPDPVFGICVDNGCTLEVRCEGSQCVPVYVCTDPTTGDTDPSGGGDPTGGGGPPDPCGGACN